ncbi:family 16 glycosylhydrolase [Fulvivirgaceae bacterium PWU5]|uniref:Family 16 glycosylhydrolase n=1 Tax=Dawidia cretensis TaxID=2782350 RepID=A0AAP2E2K8_9BACT|nr:family 16 glycosylhydrolase [Dawidia cretensis]MBT1711891.1 family 16 glycosylhydrolase [Dawidia cretensis]
MKKHIAFALFSFALLGLAASCSDDEASATLTLPSNLEAAVTVDAKAPSKVSVVATAKDVNFYTVYFGDSDTETPTRTADGKASHTYAKLGTYTVRVQAHTTVMDYVTVEKAVEVKEFLIPTSGHQTPESYDGMTLVWRDEFNGTTLNAADWTHELGNGVDGWGNNELQYYRPENTQVKEGVLIITAKKESQQGYDYTSSRIVTAAKKEFRYGRIDIRAVLPQGKGIWPALWMLGANYQTDPWPKCGEIDIMELVGGGDGDKTVHGTAHWEAGDGSKADYTGSTSLESGTFGDEFHVFSIEWTPEAITWYVDDEQFHVINIEPEDLNEFQKEFFFIFNVAVGGNWPGSPDANTMFPQRMMVDYVRVFQQMP